jgi:photosystem II stability/assembly factor-like uncharacterized protein
MDGGATWQRRAVGGAEKLDFRDIDAMSARVAFVLSIGPGDSSRIYRTSDGGARWELQFTGKDPQVFLDAMAFWDTDRGIAFSDSADGRFVVLSTADGGRTWTRIPPDGLPPALPGEGAFAASGTNVAVKGPDHVWIGTGAGRVLRSVDGGHSWTVHTTPIGTGESAGIFSIAFRDALHGVVVGGDYRNERAAADNAATTADGGETWTRVTPRGLGGYRSAVAWVPGRRTTVMAVGPSGSDISSDDGGTWMPIAGEGFDALGWAPDAPVGWAAGQAGRIAKLVVRN